MPYVAPTCYKAGLTEGKQCNICDTIVVEQTVVPTIDCIAGSWIVDKEATKTEDGKSHTNCTMCGKTIEKVLYATGSEGLSYTLNDDGVSYRVSVGSCKDTEIVIPKYHRGYPVTSIGDYAFSDCSSLTSVVIPDSVTSVGDDAFAYCYSLIEVINKSSFNIVAGSSDYGYVGYHAKQVITDESQSAIKTVGNYIFYDDGTDIYLVKYLGNDTEITLPEYDGGKEYGIWNFAFYNCRSLRSVVIPDLVTSIGDGAFYYCTSLASVEIGDSVTSIGDGTFDDCTSLTSIVIPDSVTSIGAAFSDCTSLTSVVIPDSVTSIDSFAFYGCPSLTIYCEATSKPSGWGEWWNLNAFDPYYIPVVWGYKGE